MLTLQVPGWQIVVRTWSCIWPSTSARGSWAAARPQAIDQAFGNHRGGGSQEVRIINSLDDRVSRNLEVLDRDPRSCWNGGLRTRAAAAEDNEKRSQREGSFHHPTKAYHATGRGG